MVERFDPPTPPSNFNVPSLARSLVNVGTKINAKLWDELKEKGTLEESDLKVFFGCTCALALGLAHFGRVTESMERLDAALILGAPFKHVEALVKFVEPHASR